MEDLEYYILFPNHQNGIKLYNALKELKINATITPTPRRASSSCGISLLVEKENIEKIKECIKQKNVTVLDIIALPKLSSPKNDRFC
jgi:hypothetical protein